MVLLMAVPCNGVNLTLWLVVLQVCSRRSANAGCKGEEEREETQADLRASAGKLLVCLTDTMREGCCVDVSAASCVQAMHLIVCGCVSDESSRKARPSESFSDDGKQYSAVLV